MKALFGHSWGNSLVRSTPLLPLEFLDPLLQALAGLPEHRRHPLVVQRHQFPVLEGFELAEALAQRARLVDLLRHEARLLGGAVDSIVAPGLHAVEELLRLRRRERLDVRLEPLVREVLEAVEADHLAVAASSRVRLDDQIGGAARGVEGDVLVQGVELHAAVGQRHQLAPAPRGRVVLRGEEEARHSRGRLVDDRELAEAAGVPEPRDRGKLGVHLQPGGAAGEEQVGQAGLRGDGPVDPQRVVDQDALRTSFDREPGGGRVAAHQRRFEPEVADDLQVGGDAAVGAEGARGRRAAHGELRDVRRGGVQGAGRRHRHVRVQADASVGEAGQQRAVFVADRYQGVLDLEVAGRALQLGRLHEGGGGEAVDRQIGGGGDAPAVLQGGDAAVDGADVRLQGAHAAVDGRDRASERVEGGHQGVAAVALGLAPAVRLDLDDAAVAQDGPPGEGRPEEQASYEAGHELLLDEVEEAVALGHRGVPHKVPGVERREVAVAQVPPVGLRLGVGVAGELERGFREDGVGRQGRPGQEGLDHGGSDVGAHQGLEARVGADREVPLVGQRLGQEPRAGDGIVDLRLGSRAGPILGERGRELGVQLGPRVIREQLAGHVALRLGLRVVIREIHVSQCIGDLLIDFGPGVEVQQSRDDLGIDLGAVVVAGKGRGDGRGHRAAGGVVAELAGHEARHLPLVPVGHQGRGDEGLHLRLVLELGQVQGVDGSGDRCARLQLRVGFAAGIAV